MALTTAQTDWVALVFRLVSETRSRDDNTSSGIKHKEGEEMQEPAIATKIREALDARTGNNFGAISALVTDDVEWHEIGREEPFRGRDAVMARLADRYADYKVEQGLHDVLSNDHHAVAFWGVTATRDGKTLSFRMAEIFEIHDGKITERWENSSDTAPITKFFS